MADLMAPYWAGREAGRLATLEGATGDAFWRRAKDLTPPHREREGGELGWLDGVHAGASAAS